MKLAPRITAFVVLAVGLAAVFIRLGVWQLARLGERRAQVAATRDTLALAPIPFDSTFPPIDAPLNRRVVLEGEPAYDREFVVTGRTRNGSPGVHIVTPVRIPGRDYTVMVLRGWVYASDAATVDLSRWRESRKTFHGYTARLAPQAHDIVVKGRGTPRFGRGSAERLSSSAPDRTYVISLDSAADSAPARLPLPSLDANGPHLNYAIQWFAFAAIALIGAGVVVRKAQGLPRRGEEKPVA